MFDTIFCGMTWYSTELPALRKILTPTEAKLLSYHIGEVIRIFEFHYALSYIFLTRNLTHFCELHTRIFYNCLINQKILGYFMPPGSIYTINVLQLCHSYRINSLRVLLKIPSILLYRKPFEFDIAWTFHLQTIVFSTLLKSLNIKGRLNAGRKKRKMQPNFQKPHPRSASTRFTEFGQYQKEKYLMISTLILKYYNREPGYKKFKIRRPITSD